MITFSSQDIPRVVWNTKVRPSLCYLDPSRNSTLIQINPIHALPLYFYKTSHQRLCFPKYFIPSGLTTKILFLFAIYSNSVLWPTHVILLDFMFREKFNAYSEAPHYKIFSIPLLHSQTHNVLLTSMNTKLET